MKRTSILIALFVLGALPIFAQSSEFGFIVGGSRRFVDGAPSEAGVEFDDGTFSFSNNSFDLFWSIPLDEDTWFKIKGGRIETTVPVAYQIDGNDTIFRRDAEGEVQHLEGNVEYRFSEAFGSTALFAGAGFYRQTAPEADSSNSWGLNAGLNADFPITRRYGVVVEATYHWVRTEFQPRYLTVGGGFRIAF